MEIMGGGEQAHVELLQIRRISVLLGENAGLSLHSSAWELICELQIWIPLADRADKHISSASLRSQAGYEIKKKKDVRPLCHCYWVSCHMMDNVIARPSFPSSQYPNYAKKKKKSIVFRKGENITLRLMLYIMSPL